MTIRQTFPSVASKRMFVLKAIKLYFLENKCAPTVRELSKITGIPIGSLYPLLWSLAADGYLTFPKGKKRRFIPADTQISFLSPP